MGIQGTLGGINGDSRNTWWKIGGFREHLGIWVPIIEDNLIAFKGDSETTRRNVDGIMDNRRKCRRIQGQPEGVGGFMAHLENVAGFRANLENVARFRANLEEM